MKTTGADPPSEPGDTARAECAGAGVSGWPQAAHLLRHADGGSAPELRRVRQ